MLILSYSDIHYHSYLNGITLSDVAAIEDQICEAARECDLVIFAGDRFAARNELGEVKYVADQQLVKLSKLGIPICILVGNHDRYTKSPSSHHSIEYVSLYPKDLSNVILMDKKKIYSPLPGLHLHALPSEVNIDGKYDFSLPDKHVLLFHCMVNGTVYQNKMKVSNGIDPQLLDRSEFSFVIGGDNHKGQKLPLNNTQGIFCGAPLQHNWGDSGEIRGFHIIDISASPATSTLVPSKSPRFIKESTNLPPGIELLNWVASKVDEWSNNIIWLVINGEAGPLNTIHVPQWESKLQSSTGARRVKIQLKFQNTTKHIETKKMSDAEEWHNFIQSQKALYTEVDLNEIEQLGLSIIKDVS